ncbi:hypothetical protein AB3R30_07905 [Leptolyngbyaceae cyanobacterium UHCC 1019]
MTYQPTRQEDVTVEQIFVQAGDRMKAGAPLIVLRNRDAQRLSRIAQPGLYLRN